MQYKKEIEQYLEANREEMLALLRELIAVRSVQGEPAPGAPFGEAPLKALHLMLQKAQEYGFAAEEVDGYAGCISFGAAPSLGILAHLDVVPEGEGWTHPPYTLTYEPETQYLYGRGTSDDKGPAVAALFAMRAVKELGIPLHSGVQLILGTNEENGSEDLRYYMAHRTLPPMVFTPDGEYPVIHLEKGMARLRLSGRFPQGGPLLHLKAGEAVNAVPVVAVASLRGFAAGAVQSAHRSLADLYPDFPVLETVPEGEVLHLTMRGTSAHASTPEKGRNALTALLALLHALHLPGAQGETIALLQMRFPYGETDGSACGVAAHDARSGALTMVLSVMELSNTDFTAHVDIRFPVCCTGAEVTQGMQRALSPLDCEVLMCDEPHDTDENSPFVRTLLRVYEVVTGEEGHCLAIGGGTYVHHIEGGVAFGCEFPGTDIRMHGADEFIPLPHLMLDAQMMALAVTELCGG
ncbi:MAG: Sapep family Mn(2+)-dependent dipeptidase [Oscillospiraceae bacterium]|nr:Sapep family Mn(2+)-dependent dipeptidase [Oscillospiraceae bacterium]